MRISQQLTLNTPYYFDIFGNHFLLETVPAGTVDVDFFRGNAKLEEELRGVGAGWYVFPKDGFDRLVITPSQTQVIAFQVNRGRVGSNVFSGSVIVTNATMNGADVIGARAVTNVSLTIVNANAARKKLVVQNQHASANLYVRCDGVAATVSAGCIRIQPGQVWEPYIAPTGAVNAIMDAATAGNTVHAIEA